MLFDQDIARFVFKAFGLVLFLVWTESSPPHFRDFKLQQKKEASMGTSKIEEKIKKAIGKKFSWLAKKVILQAFALGNHMFCGKLLHPQALEYDQTPWLCIYNDVRC